MMHKSILIAVIIGSLVIGFIPTSDTPKHDEIINTVEAKEQKKTDAKKKKEISKAEEVAPIPKPAPKPKPKPAPVIQIGQVSVEQVKAWIVEAANHYGVSADRLLTIANCESGYNNLAVNYNYYENGHPSGVFQHISGYWPSRAANYGFAGASVFDAKAQAYVTAGMFRDGASGLWECKA